MKVDELDSIRFRAAWLETQRAAGEEFGPQLLAVPVANWRDEIDHNPEFRSYGTLAFLLDEIHQDLHQHPALAYERIVVVLRYVHRVDVPASSFSTWLEGVAWREYANALCLTKSPSAAADAAAWSRLIFDSSAGFEFEAAKADLVHAIASREMGDFDLAYMLARRSARTFREHNDAAYYEMARSTEAWILFGRKQYREALSIFSETAKDAEKRGDKKALAMCLHDAAECARALGDDEHGRDLSRRAVELLNKVGNAIDAPRVRWVNALDVAKHGQPRRAISELYKVRAEFLGMGMNTDAATAALDIARLAFELGDDITQLCTELVSTFSAAGMTASAIEALAYLREEAKRGTISTSKITRVRTHITESARIPALVFARPRDEEG